jgi:TonB family protein
MWAAAAFRALALLALGACVLSLSGLAQEPPQKTDRTKPLALQPFASNSSTDAGPIEIGNLQDFAARLLHHAPDAGCLAKCKILVTDFVFPDGSTFPNGIWWADELSRRFASPENKVQVVDRALLSYFMQKQNIPAKIANTEPTARWLGKKCDATVVLIGQAKMVTSGVVELSARFLNVNDNNLIGPSSEVDLAVDTPANLAPMDGLSPALRLPPFPKIVDGEKVYRPGTNGVGTPSCFYMPNPPYTKDAREAKFSGSITVEAALGSDGLLRAVRIVKGAPFGLNEEVIKVLSTWKCKPAQLDRKPVTTVVHFEVNFRLYDQ